MYLPLVLVPVFTEGVSNSKNVVKCDQNSQSLANVLKHCLQ